MTTPIAESDSYKLKRQYANIITIPYKPPRHRSMVAQMAERAPRDRKVPNSNPALDPMRCVSKYNRY